MGKIKTKIKFRQLFSKSPEINILSAARFFLFGARDVWFVVGLPIFLYSVLGWSFQQVGGFLAIWVIGYGLVQSLAPTLLKRFGSGRPPEAKNNSLLDGGFGGDSRGDRTGFCKWVCQQHKPLSLA